MKNKRMISLLLAAAMMIALVPATAFAYGAFDGVSVTEPQFYASGSLQSFKVSYTNTTGSSGEIKMGIHTQAFAESYPTNSYGDLTNKGKYSIDHEDYDSWADAATPDDCGFVCWNADGAYDNYGSVTKTINFEDGIIPAGAPGTYYVYAWTYWNNDQARYSKVYPDAFIFSFTIGEDSAGNSTIDIDTTTPPAPTTHTHDWIYTLYETDNKISAYCSIGGADCNRAGGPAVGVKITLDAPDAEADGAAYDDATITGLEAFNTETGNSLSTADIEYYDEAGTTKLAAAPSEAGKYMAKITVYNDNTPVTASDPFEITAATTPNVPNNPAPTAPAGKDNWVKYNGGNNFSSNKSAVPTSVEIDGQEVSFVGNGKSFTVGCVPAGAQRITVRWNSTSITTNFKPDAAAYCSEVEIPKTGDLSLLGYAVMAIVAAAGAMGLKK